jgi:hypothetical protein
MISQWSRFLPPRDDLPDTRSGGIAVGKKARPESSLYRHFLYVDTQEVLNGLSCFEKGSTEEHIAKIIHSGGADLKLAMSTLIGTIEFGGKGSRTIEDQFRRKATIYSSVTALLQHMRDSKDLKQIDVTREFDFGENDVIEFAGDLELSPEPRMSDKPSTGFSLEGLLTRLRPSQEDVRRTLRAARGLERYATAKVNIGGSGWTAVMGLDCDCLTINHRDKFEGLATVIAQVEASYDDKRSLDIVRAKDGWIPKLYGRRSAELDAPLAEGVPERVPAPDDWLLVRPLCIFK